MTSGVQQILSATPKSGTNIVETLNKDARKKFLDLKELSPLPDHPYHKKLESLVENKECNPRRKLPCQLPIFNKIKEEALEWKEGAVGLFLQESFQDFQECRTARVQENAIISNTNGIPKSNTNVTATVNGNAREKFSDDIKITDPLPDHPYYQKLEFLADKDRNSKRKLPCKLPVSNNIKKETYPERKKVAVELSSQESVQNLQESLPSCVQKDAVILNITGIPQSDANLIATLKGDARKHAEKFLEDLAETNSLSDHPYCQDLEYLAEKGRKLPCNLIIMNKLERTLKEASEWKKGAAKLFSRGSSLQDLHECITPRVQEDDVIFNTNSYMCAEYILDAYRKAEVAEIDLIKRLRERNDKESKSGLGWFCTCTGDLEGVMYKCELCHAWYHERCVKPEYGRRFLCPYCSRTRRPKLAALLPLVKGLGVLQVRLPEGDALVSMVKRAMRWQEIVKNFFRVEEVDEFIAKSAIFKKGRKRRPVPVSNEVSNEMKHEIDELLIEGFVMEMYLEDVGKLWRIWKFIRDDPFVLNFDKYLKENPLPRMKTSPIHLSAIRFLQPPREEYHFDGGGKMEENTEETEICAAQKCLQPRSEEIIWIQCDGACSRWFHMACIDIKTEEVGPKDRYYCFDCRLSFLPDKFAIVYEKHYTGAR